MSEQLTDMIIIEGYSEKYCQTVIQYPKFYFIR